MTDFNIVLENEKKRSDVKEVRKIYMYPEGSFMRAFDYSAWLWCKYIKDFKAIRRKIKDSDETVVQIGCPLSSLSKHLPEEAVMEQNPDGSVVITLTENIIPDDADLAEMASVAEDWMLSCRQVSESVAKPKKVPAEYFERQPLTITGIMQQILAFPIENKSMAECVSFLSGIKIQLAKLI